MPPGVPPVRGLETLHEILLPAPPNWMPQTVGWFVALALVLIVIGRWILRRVRRFERDRYRRSALEELALIEQRLRQSGRVEALAAVPVLLKRTALAAFPRREVASLSGTAWIAFLDDTMGGNAFTDAEGRLLTELAYVPQQILERLPAESLTGLLQLARRWISTHTA